jgi:RES domain
MLEGLPVGTHSARVVRFANPRDDVAALRALGINQDSMQEMLDLLSRRAAPGGMERLIDGSFEPWNPVGPPYGPETRFSDGTWPVCYTATDRKTAEDEIKYHRGKVFFSGGTGRGFTVYYHLVEITYVADTIDLRKRTKAWPELIEPDEKRGYPFCQTLGREARDRKLGGFLTRSARRRRGTNVPVFSRVALTVPQSRAVAAFVADYSSGDIRVKWL